MYKDIHKSRLCSARLEASTGPRTEGIPDNIQRGRGSGPCLLPGGLDNSRHKVTTTLFVRDLYKAVGGQSTRPIFLDIFQIWIKAQSMT